MLARAQCIARGGVARGRMAQCMWEESFTREGKGREAGDWGGRGQAVKGGGGRSRDWAVLRRG